MFRAPKARTSSVLPADTDWRFFNSWPIHASAKLAEQADESHGGHLAELPHGLPSQRAVRPSDEARARGTSRGSPRRRARSAGAASGAAHRSRQSARVIRSGESDDADRASL